MPFAPTVQVPGVLIGRPSWTSRTWLLQVSAGAGARCLELSRHGPKVGARYAFTRIEDRKARSAGLKDSKGKSKGKEKVRIPKA